MKHITLANKNSQTIAWLSNQLVDWMSAGQIISLTEDAATRIGKYHFAYSFDSCITSKNDKYAFLFKKLGTKGLLLKNGEIMREINRSYYRAETYEYPAAFLEFNNKTYLIHCPLSYDRIDIEDVESGKIITSHCERNPDAFFHSRLEVSPDNKYLMSKGWIWHPMDYVYIFDIDACIKNPALLDKSNFDLNTNCDITTASFISDHQILLGAADVSEPFDPDIKDGLQEGQIGIWNISTNSYENLATVNGKFGNLFAINDQWAFDMYKHPKLINIQTGEIADQIETIDSGTQCSSIIWNKEYVPQICFNRELAAIAVLTKDGTIEVVQL